MGLTAMRITIRFLSRDQVESLAPHPSKLVEVIAAGLAAHGRGDVVMPPKAHLQLDHLFSGHFNILPGYVGTIGRAGVKVVGDYVENWRHGLPSELALLTLYEPRTGTPTCIMDATALTWMRTGAVTCVGALHLANPTSRILAHLGARGTAFTNILLLAHHFPIEEARICSARPETRERLAEKVRRELGLRAVAFDDPALAAADADIVVEATRLSQPEILLPERCLKRGALLVTYGWVRAIDPALPRAVDRLVVDDWAQCCLGGQLYELIADGTLRQDDVDAEIGQIVAGLKPGRQHEDERILFWHRGFAVSDVVLGDYVFRRAEAEQIGTMLLLADVGEE
ncbi:MAG: ornithine cyclodeaminase family protein [Acetobacteraceae bacterium]